MSQLQPAAPAHIATTITEFQPQRPSSSLPPSPTLPGPSSSTKRPAKRTIYFGIKRGRTPGVYTSSRLAEEQVADYPEACLRCFSTRYAASAYVGGWDCKGKFALPKGAPYPLFEYLLVHFSTPAYLLSPIPRRRAGSQAPRPIPNMNEFGAFPGSEPHPSLASSSDTLSHRSSSSTLRPPTGSHRDSWRGSMVKSPSPLRHQVNEPELTRPWMERAQSAMMGGTSQADPEREAETMPGTDKGKRSSIFGFPTFNRKPSASAGKPLTSPEITSASDFAPSPPRPDLRTSRSNPTLPRSTLQHPPSRLNPNPKPNPQSGLWSTPTSPLAGPSSPSVPLPSPRNSYQAPSSSFQAPQPVIPTFANTNAPTFSRAALRKSGVVMPTAAPSAPRRSPSTPSLSPSSSSSSISTISSSSSHGGGSRISTQASAPTFDFAPPQAGFMRRPSSLSPSISSSSSESVATITSSSPTEESDSYSDSVYDSKLFGMTPCNGARTDNRDAKKGVMKGFGRMFGMKKKV